MQTSCAMGVPYFTYGGDREQLVEWAVKKGDDGVRDHWGIRLTRADHEAVIDRLEDGNASLAFEEPDRAERALATRIQYLCRQIHVAEAQLR